TRGAAALLAKPFDISVLEALIPAPESDAEEAEVIRYPTFEEIVGGNMLFPALQPIVQLGDESPYGYESLARCNTASLLAMPDALFDYANRKGRVAELELACIRATFAQCGDDVPRLFLNLHPAVIVDERLPDVLEAARGGTALRAEQIVLEITEQQPLGDALRVARHGTPRKRPGSRWGRGSCSGDRRDATAEKSKNWGQVCTFNFGHLHPSSQLYTKVKSTDLTPIF